MGLLFLGEFVKVLCLILLALFIVLTQVIGNFALFLFIYYGLWEE